MTRREFLKNCVRLTFGVLLVDTLFVEKQWIEFTEHHLKRESFTERITFVQVSDVHLNFLTDFLLSAVDKINQMRPDFIFFTGDMIDNKDRKHLLEKFLARFSPDIVKVAIMGNWEYWGDISVDYLEKVYGANGCKLLRNEAQLFDVRGKRILVSGFDDYVTRRADYKKTQIGFQSNDYHIVLNHCPEYRNFVHDSLNTRQPIDVMLSGHTHGGQVNFFGYTPIMPPGAGHYLKGWYREKNPKMYVNRGIGVSCVPFRFNSRSEITVFHAYL